MVDRIDDGAPDSVERIQQLVDNFHGPSADAPDNSYDEDVMQELAREVHNLKEKPRMWSKVRIRTLLDVVQKAIEETAARIKTMDPRNTYALDQAVENLKNQIRHMLETLNPPPEIIESPEFRELMEFLQPSSGQHQGQSTFSRGSGMHGRMKSAVMIQKVTEALAAASKMVKQAALQAQKSGDSQTNASMQHFSNLSMMQMARYLRRKLRKRKVDENGQPILEETDEDILLRSEMEMFCAHAAATMRAMREEIAPRWAPEQQPWLIQESDRQVYDILLAVVPEALFKETEYYQEIQDLRSGQAVFTLRAADRLTEGAKR